MKIRPVSERILAALRGSRLLWIVAWSLVPWLNAAANLLLERRARSAVWDQSPTLIVLNYAALSLAIAITLLGSERIARRLEALRSTIGNVLEVDAREQFHEINSVAGPLFAAALTAIAFAISALVSGDGWTAALLRGGTWLVVGVALWSFLWTYAALQLGLDRLGRERLHPDAARIGPTLGLQPLGDLAFLGLAILLAWLVPVLFTGLPDLVGLAIGLALLGGSLALFFLSLFRLHRQMVRVKENELAVARQLYADAYKPVAESQTLEALERRHTLLGAADALEKRAQAIHEWPVGEGTVTRVVTVTTSVTAISVARLILDPLGL